MGTYEERDPANSLLHQIFHTFRKAFTQLLIKFDIHIKSS